MNREEALKLASGEKQKEFVNWLYDRGLVIDKEISSLEKMMGEREQQYKSSYKNFGNAVMEFLLIKFKYCYEKGEYDYSIRSFLDANPEDSLELNFKIQLVPNDIIIMRLLSGGTLDDTLIENVKKLWDRERDDKKNK